MDGVDGTVLQMMGLILPWFGPLVGLFVISPLIEMGIAESRQLTAQTQCLENAVNICDATSTFEYFFWNITNPDEVCRPLFAIFAGWQ